MPAFPRRSDVLFLTPRHLLAIAALVALGRAPVAYAWEPEEKPLPISSITLYRSGVGYFEREGRVQGNSTVQLRFATEQVNDILKSMVVLDLGGGSVGSVRYGSQEPLERRLASFAIDVSESASIEDLLGQMRGAVVRLTTAEGTVEGTVVGVETRTQQVEKGATRLPYVNLLTAKGLRSVGLFDASNLEIVDPMLAAELSKALTALAEHRADNTKAVDMSFNGTGDRDIFVAYIHEMPVWKTSYRLVLPEPGNDSKPTIQGWAIVENNTDEDWQNVGLSLVAGQPVSFTMDLYQPLYVERPELPVPVAAGVAPRTYEGGMAGGGGGQSPFQSRDASRADYDKAPEFDMNAMQTAPGRPLASLTGNDGRRRAGIEVMSKVGLGAAASGTESGEVFLYRLDTPVTIERRQSAMLPILGSAVEGERVSIYTVSDGGKHPMLGVSLVNSTSLQFMPGPISVFDGSAYAGDATISHVGAGEKRLLSFAVDLEVDASTANASSMEIRRVSIVNGLIVQSYEREERATHTFTNKDRERARVVVVEHPRNDSWTLVTPEKPDETTDSLYRFRLNVEPGKSENVTVVQRRTDRQQMEITAIDHETLLRYQKDGKVSQLVLDAFTEAARLSEQVVQATNRFNEANRAASEIAPDQERIRQNMSGIDRNSQLYARYVQKLNEQETLLESLRAEQNAAKAERDRAQAAYESFVRSLNIE